MLFWTYQSLTEWIKRAVLKGDIFHHLDSKAFLFFLMYLIPAVVRCRTQQKNSLSETAWQLLSANVSVLLICLCKFTCTYACANTWEHMHKVYLEQMALAIIGNKRSEQLHSLIPPSSLTAGYFFRSHIPQICMNMAISFATSAVQLGPSLRKEDVLNSSMIPTNGANTGHAKYI